LSLPKSVYERKPKRLPKSLGFSRYALDFTPANSQYVDVPSSTGDELNPDNVTVICWVYVDSAGQNAGIVARGQTSANQSYVIYVYDNNFNFRIVDSEGDIASVTEPEIVGEWTHLALAYDGSEVEGFVNGETVGTASPATPSALNEGDWDVWIGTYWDGTYYLDGKVDEVQIYDRVLSSSEIRDIMLDYHQTPDLAHLVGWWRFEEGTDLTAYDESGNGNDGTLKPAASPPVWTDVKKWELRSEGGL